MPSAILINCMRTHSLIITILAAKYQHGQPSQRSWAFVLELRAAITKHGAYGQNRICYN